MRTMLKWVVAACLVGLLASCDGKSNGGPGGGGSQNGDGGGGGGVQSGLLKGRVVDSKGQPLSGTVIYTALAASNGSLTKTTTDTQGNYQVPLTADVPYKVYAWQEVTYRGKKFCLRVPPEDSTGYDTFGKAGAIRNFTWRLTGRMEDSSFGPDEDGGWYGGSIRLFNYFDDGDYKSSVELKLTPSAPLIDGSTGAVVTKVVDLQKTTFALDIPAGAYKVSATRIKSDGSRLAARVGPSSSEGYAEFDFEFSPVSTTLDCGSSATSSGLERGILYVLSP